MVVPSCPFCQRTTDLKRRRDGLRCCEPCRSESKIETCAVCCRQRPIGGRRFDGQPVCGTCRQHAPFNHRPCSVCGEMRFRKSRTDNGGVCAACREIPTAICATCGQRGPCYFAATDALKCLPCSAKEREETVCVNCGNHRRVNNRTAIGEPLCGNCGNKPKPCVGCGGIFRISGRTPEGEPLCQTCWAKHPVAHRPCTQCGSVERLYRHGQCAACVRAADLRDVVSPPGDLMHPELEPVFQALLKPPPRTVLRWIHKIPARRAVLQAPGHGARTGHPRGPRPLRHRADCRISAGRAGRRRSPARPGRTTRQAGKLVGKGHRPILVRRGAQDPAQLHELVAAATTPQPACRTARHPRPAETVRIEPGRPIGPHTLGRRLKVIGVPPQLARHASLMDIASELPAVVISRLLGLHQSTGDNWTRESQGFGSEYAADIIRR